MEKRHRNAHFRNSNSDVAHKVIEYKFGKSFTPMRINSRLKTQRSGVGSSKNTFDRPELISKIHHLVMIHGDQRVRNDMQGTTCSRQLHYALHKAIRMCYEQRVYESKLLPVGDLFLELYLCDGNLNAIFSILCGHVGEKSHHMNANVNIVYPEHVGDGQQAFEYYLYHVSSLKDHHYGADMGQNLDIVNKVIDHDTTPLSAAIQKRDPGLVLSLLRFGADPFLAVGPPPDDDERNPDPTQLLLEDINGLFLFLNTGFSPDVRATLAAEEKKAWLCLKYFRRSVLSIPVAASRCVITTTEDDDDEASSTLPRDQQRSYQLHPAIADGLDMGVFKVSASLQHCCRIAIRQALTRSARATNMPRGIQLLPIPKPLKAYIDLAMD